MARTPEGAVKDKVTAILKKHGTYYFFPATGGLGRGGVPDIIACHRGGFIGIECKAGKGKTTALQDAELEKIGRAGGRALVIRETNIADVEKLLVAINNLDFIRTAHDPTND